MGLREMGQVATKKAEAVEVIQTYKGFGLDWKCRDFQYAVGETFTYDGTVAACESGFHACEYPLDVLGYYAPGTSRYAIVEQSGQLARHSSDSKVASSTIKVSDEIGLPGLIKAAIEYTFERAKPEAGSSATGDQGAASATGYQGKASGIDGNALFLVERDIDYKIISVWAGIVGKKGIKADTFYMLRNGKPVIA
jgi:hypothetical protein